MPVFFLNLSAAEFFVLLGTVGGLVTSLYLLDRRKKRRVVSTLQFWSTAVQAEDQRSRRHVQQPWSLLLQLGSLLLLLLAVAQLQWGLRPKQANDHVMLIDTSSWSGAILSPGERVLDRELALARRYLRSLPAKDRVLLVKADAIATPLGSFSSDRATLAAQLDRIAPSRSALHLEQAFDLSSQALRSSAETAGETVYIGPGFSDDKVLHPPASLRLLPVPVTNANLAITSLTAKQPGGLRGDWTAAVTIRNSGSSRQAATLRAGYAGTLFSPRSVILGPNSSNVQQFRFTTVKGGVFSVRLVSANGSADSVTADDTADLPLPSPGPIQIVAWTRRHNQLAPLLESDPALSVRYLDPVNYRPSERAALFVFDGFAPAVKPALPSLYLHIPSGNQTFPVSSVAQSLTVSQWDGELLGDSGLHSQELPLAETDVFRRIPGLRVVALTSQGPVVVAQQGNPRSFAIGFDPLDSKLRVDLTTPLLIANALHWLLPEAFRPPDYLALPAGAIELPLEPNETAESLRISSASGTPIPFSVQDQRIQFFVNTPQMIEIRSPNRQRTLAVTLARAAETKWQVPASAAVGMPASADLKPLSNDLWQLLAILGALGLTLEWILFGWARRGRLRHAAAPIRRADKMGQRLSA